MFLKGILKNIRHSHTIEGTVFNKADLIVKRPNGREDLITLKFKEFSLIYKEDDEIELSGNIRSFSQQLDGKNKVEIYVFSYFDNVECHPDTSNSAVLTGKVCKKDTLRTTSSGKHYIHYIIANNIVTDDGQKMNSYVPCVAWGKLARDFDMYYNIGDDIEVEGQLQSREYKKKLPGKEIELRVAHELATTTMQKV